MAPAIRLPLDLAGEIANSIAADDTGVYLVTTQALVKVALDSIGKPEVVWQREYDHGSQQKPGQLSAGSGTTPTLLPSGLVAITDNADSQMHVQFYDALDGSLVCQAAVFGKDESASDNSLVAVGDASVVVENNYGYEAPWTTMAGRATPGGLARVDADPDTGECSVGWRSDEVAPTSVAKVSLATGLVYAYTTRASWWGVSAWYLTAIDARTGETAFSVRTGTGTLFNNHYSAVTLAADGSAYVPTLGGMVRVKGRLEVELAEVVRYVDGVLPQRLQRDELEDRLVGRGQHHRCGRSVTVGARPVDRGHAPPVARHQAGEGVLRHRRGQVVADAPLVAQELLGHHRADRVAAEVLGTGVAASVPEEAGHRVGAAGLQLTAQDIALGHASSIAPRPGTPGCAGNDVGQGGTRREGLPSDRGTPPAARLTT